MKHAKYFFSLLPSKKFLTPYPTVFICCFPKKYENFPRIDCYQRITTTDNKFNLIYLLQERGFPLYCRSLILASKKYSLTAFCFLCLSSAPNLHVIKTCRKISIQEHQPARSTSLTIPTPCKIIQTFTPDWECIYPFDVLMFKYRSINPLVHGENRSTK